MAKLNFATMEYTLDADSTDAGRFMYGQLVPLLGHRKSKV